MINPFRDLWTFKLFPLIPGCQKTGYETRGTKGIGMSSRKNSLVTPPSNDWYRELFLKILGS